ncbi:MarR family winged helix-turn-helix transcriptional regulator [Paenibacillus sediminis]|nr:MarR family transcriptional regulator [Paenibacillus sediminis]
MSQLIDDKQLSLHLMIVLSRAYNSVTDVTNRNIHSYNLNPTEFGVLDLLYHKGDQPLQKIGEKVLISSGNITYVVDKLQKKNLVQRRACEEDRRVIYAELTEQGRKFFEEIFPQHELAIQRAVSALNEEEKKTAIELLKKLGLGAANLKS